MDKFKIIFHRGRHKIGITSIEKFCLKNRELLNKYGYNYPNIYIKGPAHYLISNLLLENNYKKLNNLKIDNLIEKILKDIVSTY